MWPIGEGGHHSSLRQWAGHFCRRYSRQCGLKHPVEMCNDDKRYYMWATIDWDWQDDHQKRTMARANDATVKIEMSNGMISNSPSRHGECLGFQHFDYEETWWFTKVAECVLTILLQQRSMVNGKADDELISIDQRSNIGSRVLKEAILLWGLFRELWIHLSHWHWQKQIDLCSSLMISSLNSFSWKVPWCTMRCDVILPRSPAVIHQNLIAMLLFDASQQQNVNLDLIWTGTLKF